MNIRILSDLHLEHGTSHEFAPLPDDRDSIMVLAGDIGAFRFADNHLVPFLTMLCERFRHVLYVFGNHEFYRSTWPDAGYEFQARNDLPENLHVLNPGVVEIDTIAFIGTTLWTSFELDGESCMDAARAWLNDYKFVYTRDEPSIPSTPNERVNNGQTKHGRSVTTVQHEASNRVQAEHRRQRVWLANALAQHQSKPVVLITHHGISKQSIHARFDGNPINGAFVNALEPVLEKHPPSLAIHGHVHNSFDYTLTWSHGQTTRVVVNPRGYEMRHGGWENESYDPELAVCVLR